MDPVDTIVAGMAVGVGARDAEDQAFVDLVAPDPELDPMLLGGGAYVPYVDGGDLWSAVAFGSVLDADRHIVLGPDAYGVPILVSDVAAAAPGLPDGAYQLYALPVRVE